MTTWKRVVVAVLTVAFTIYYIRVYGLVGVIIYLAYAAVVAAVLVRDPLVVRRMVHRVRSHPAEARFEGDLTAGCTIGPQACGAVWDVEEPQ